MNYELIYILTPKLSEDDAKKKMTTVSKSISDKIDKVAMEDFWGKRELAYPVKKFTDGYYVVLQFTAESEKIGKIEKELRLTEDVIRFLIVKKDSLAKSKDEIKAPTVLSAAEKAERAKAKETKETAEKDAKESKKESKSKKAKAKISDLDDKLDDILEKGIDD
ncbi:MAG: 30S ribosomal protein S6 [Parcubacteria group bacterium]|nr:30S ribosomal protein S6 [Parcubacteria group bacterium]